MWPIDTKVNCYTTLNFLPEMANLRATSSVSIFGTITPGVSYTNVSGFSLTWEETDEQ